MKYPFSPEILDAMPEELAEVFRELELVLLMQIADRVKAAGKLNEVTISDIKALRSHGIPLKEIKAEIAKAAKISRQKVEKLFADAIEWNEIYYGWLAGASKMTMPEVLVGAAEIDAIIRQTKQEMINITRSMGFMVNGQAIPPARAYQWALDNALMQVESGAISYGQAISTATQQLADSGLGVVNYESGHRDQIDVAVRRAVMTGVTQVNSRYAEQSMEYLDAELVEVSAHAGARDIPGPKGFESHKEWQGKVYKFSDLKTKCGLGDVQGLLGANCRHMYHPFIEGVSERTYTDEQLKNIDKPDFEYEGKKYTTYEATQKQREIERAVRKMKRRKAAAVTPEAQQAANIRIRLLNQKYKEFSNAAGLRMQPERMNVYVN